MSKVALVVFAVLLLMPAYAGAQEPERIIIPSDLGTHGKGDYLIVHGVITAPAQGSYVVVQISNPQGVMCNIQQIEPLSGGSFVTKAIALRGALCGIDGMYEMRVFYGDHVTESVFVLEGEGARVLDDDAKFAAAKSALDSRIAQTSGFDTSQFLARAASITLPLGTVADVLDVYVDLVEESFSESSLDGADVTLRRSVGDALDAVDSLKDSGAITPDGADSIRRTLYSAIFYHEIGDVREAGASLEEAYSAVRTADPTAPDPAARSFESLEETLIALMQKNGSLLTESVRSELAFILARGTAPIYADELESVLDILTMARYLEITSKSDDSLYRIVVREWTSARPLFESASTIDEIVDLKDRISDLYDAAFLLRSLDRVEEFIRSSEAGSLGELLGPAWDDLARTLGAATGTGDILANGQTIRDMKAVSDISSRIEQVIRLTRANSIDNELTKQWPALLDRVGTASSLSEIYAIVEEFDESISAMREARNPLADLRLEYRELQAMAEQQGDRLALANIDNALRVISLAERLSAGNPTDTKLDRVEVLLVWVISESESIGAKLRSYTDEDRKARSADILMRAQSLENLAELGLRTKRFVPGYADYVDDVLSTVSRIRNLVADGEIKLADDTLRRAFDDWTRVAAAYRELPPLSDEYGIIDIKRRDFQKHVDDLNDIAARFLVNGSVEELEFTRMLDRADEFTGHGNFVDAQEWITRAYVYAQEHLNTVHNNVIYDIAYDDNLRTWVISGFVNKDRFDNREDILVSVQTAGGELHSTLEFTDTKHGEFNVQWNAPSEPGIYIAELTWRNTSSSNIVYIPSHIDETQTADDRRISGGEDLISISRDLFDLREFMRGFGGERYQAHVGRITPLLDDAEDAIHERDESEARSKVVEIRSLIERYLPQRSPDAVIDVSYSLGTLGIDGALKKSVYFPEDIYVDIFDQAGTLVVTLAMTDGPDGMFSQSIVRSFDPGTYVALLSYHDLRVSDFFTVT